jgi:hypothetical protein
MFCFLPISHDSMTARRWPWVTIAIIALNVLVHVMLLLAPSNRDIEQAARRAVEFHHEHPDLKARPPLDAIERHLQMEPQHAGSDGAEPPAEESTAADQEQLDELTRDLADALTQTPSFAFGYVPARTNLLGLTNFCTAAGCICCSTCGFCGSSAATWKIRGGG